MAATTVLTDRDNGVRVSLHRGDVLRVRLPEVPSTGYRWAVEPVDELELVESRYAPESTAVGGGGVREFVFRTRNQGTASLRLKLWRDWEGESSVQERFAATIDVSED